MSTLWCDVCKCSVTKPNWKQHEQGKRHQTNLQPIRAARKRKNPHIDPNIDEVLLNQAVHAWRLQRKHEEKQYSPSLSSPGARVLEIKLEARAVIDELVCRARTFVHSEWPLLPEECIAINPFLQDARSKSVQKFMTAWLRQPGASALHAGAMINSPVAASSSLAAASPAMMGAMTYAASPVMAAQHQTGIYMPNKIPSSKSLLAQGVFGWHGTNDATNFPLIFRDAWDPRRRARQAHGHGEYFACDHDNALYYSADTKRLIVAYLLRGTHLEYVPGHCYIVQNPQDGSLSYCLPVLDILVPPGTQPSHNIHPRRWDFSWETDNNSFAMYDEATHRFLTQMFNRYMNGVLSGPVVTTPRVLRPDGQWVNYIINFKDDTQRHSLTGYTRSLKITNLQSSPLPHLWVYARDDGDYAPFFVHVVDKIQHGYIGWMQGQPGFGPKVRFDIRECHYELDFEKMVQVNTETGTVRRVVML